MIRRFVCTLLLAGLIPGAVMPGGVAAAATDAQYVRTESGKMRCIVIDILVRCQLESAEGFPNGPIIDGSRANQAYVNPVGELNWNSGDLPGAYADDLTLIYGQTSSFYGWTLTPSFDGTRFVNDRTGHGMFVAIDGATAF